MTRSVAGKRVSFQEVKVGDNVLCIRNPVSRERCTQLRDLENN